MKKITLLASSVLLLASVAFTSCKKDYTCVCTTTVAGVSTSQEISLGKQSKKDAKSACEAKVISVAGASMSCSLK